MKTKALHVSRVHTKQLSHLVPRFRLQEFDSRDPCCLEVVWKNWKPTNSLRRLEPECNGCAGDTVVSGRLLFKAQEMETAAENVFGQQAKFSECF